MLVLVVVEYVTIQRGFGLGVCFYVLISLSGFRSFFYFVYLYRYPFRIFSFTILFRSALSGVST